MSQPQDHGHDPRHDHSHHPHTKADANDPDDVRDVHEGPIRTPKQLIWTVLASFVIPVVVIILLVNFVDFGTKPGAGSDGLSSRIAQRLGRGTVDFRDISNTAAQTKRRPGYQGQCAPATHGVPTPRAREPGWAPRVSGFRSPANAASRAGARWATGRRRLHDFEDRPRRALHSSQGGGNSRTQCLRRPRRCQRGSARTERCRARCARVVLVSNCRPVGGFFLACLRPPPSRVRQRWTTPFHRRFGARARPST